MLISSNRVATYCDGVSRRDFLRAGGLGLAGLSLADVLRSETRGAGASPVKSLIYVVLSGGPSHIDMWDLKPNAPLEYRGPFRPISAALPGEFLCEHMPEQARLMDQFTLIRGIRSVENDHYLAEVYTGLPRSAGKRPAFGSIISRLSPGASPLPPFISLSRESTGEFDYERSYYAGPGHAPFRPDTETLSNLSPVKSLDQLTDRRALLRGFDAFRRETERISAYGGVDAFQAKAFDIMTSPAVREAFDLSKETEQTLVRYGKGCQYTHQTVKSLLYPWDPKPMILARRLVEAGARMVSVQLGSWDHHSGASSDIFYSLSKHLYGFDRSITALITDLKERGLENDVAVVVLGEFGRTPKITPLGPGREHWADAGCAIVWGGGMKMGQVIGATDSRAERSVDGRIGFENIVSTIYKLMGIDPSDQLTNFAGRPQSLLDETRPIRELFG